LTDKTEDKPEWMSSTPPKETVAATRADDEGVTLYNHDAGERIAAPFAEQIEDILRAKLESDPFNKFEIDFGSAKDGSLEIWVNGTMYASMDEIPDAGLKQAFHEAVKKRAAPPKETMDATRADDEGVTLFDHDAGERLAAPFAEQIEDILRAKLDSDPFNKFEIDLGTGKDGSLEIWVNGTKYASMDEIPDVGLKNAFHAAVKKWEKGR